MLQNQMFYYMEDVSEMLNISSSAAYKIIRNLNQELSSMGFITIAGRVPCKFFEEKFYCGNAAFGSGDVCHAGV